MSSRLKKVENTREGQESKVLHALVGKSFGFSRLAEHRAVFWHVLLHLSANIVGVGGNVRLALELALQQRQLTSDVLSVDSCLDALMIIEDRPEAGGGVRSYSGVLLS